MLSSSSVLPNLSGSVMEGTFFRYYMIFQLSNKVFLQWRHMLSNNIFPRRLGTIPKFGFSFSKIFFD